MVHFGRGIDFLDVCHRSQGCVTRGVCANKEAARIIACASALLGWGVTHWPYSAQWYFLEVLHAHMFDNAISVLDRNQIVIAVLGVDPSLRPTWPSQVRAVITLSTTFYVKDRSGWPVRGRYSVTVPDN